MATTYTGTKGGSTTPARRAESGVFPIVATYAVAAALVINDVVQMLKVPAGFTVLDGYLIVPDLDSNVSPAVITEVGDGGDVDRFLDGSTAGQAGGLARFNTAYLPYTYTAEDTIDVIFTTAPATSATSGTLTLVVWGTMDP